MPFWLVLRGHFPCIHIMRSTGPISCSHVNMQYLKSADLTQLHSTYHQIKTMTHLIIYYSYNIITPFKRESHHVQLRAEMNTSFSEH